MKFQGRQTAVAPVPVATGGVGPFPQDVRCQLVNVMVIAGLLFYLTQQAVGPLLPVAQPARFGEPPTPARLAELPAVI